MKDVAGYDLTKLLVGSEGTLAVITQATLKLIPPPKFKKTMLAMYKDIYGAARTVSKIIENRIIPATLEFLDNPTILVVDDFAKLGLPRSAFTALARLRPTTILEDATVPRLKIADMVLEINRIAIKYDVQICTFAMRATETFTRPRRRMPVTLMRCTGWKRRSRRFSKRPSGSAARLRANMASAW